jgi:hypothetical protein
MGYELSPKRKQQRAASRKRQDARWQRKSGPLTVRFVDPETLKNGSNESESSRPTDPAVNPERPGHAR